MKTEPRRKDRTMKTGREMERLLARMPVGHLAVATAAGPYMVAVNYLFTEGSIYFHSGPAGRKMEAIQADNRVCFLVDEIGPQVRWDRGCGISQVYKSVVCFGKAELVAGPAEKRRILEKMMQKYCPDHSSRPSLQDGNIERTAVVRIVIEGMSGKENPLSPLHTVIDNSGAGDTFDHATGRLIPCGDTQIYIEEKGGPASPVLIMLHGGFGNMEDFNKIAPALSHRFRMIGVDTRGHGKSGLGTSRLSYRLLADDLAGVIEALKLTEFSILGFSDGGITAYRYAARQDPRLDKIITVGASWEMSENEPAWEIISGMTGKIWQDMYPASYESYLRHSPAPDFDRFAAAVLAMWTDLGPDGHPEGLMGKIANKLLVIRGDNDPLTSLASMERLRRDAKHISFLNIAGAGHVAFDDAPEVFMGTVGRFFGVELNL